jgi:hypothetical protein
MKKQKKVTNSIAENTLPYMLGLLQSEGSPAST